MSIPLIIGLGLVPSITWLLFYLQEDRKHPEPFRLIVFTFILGGIVTFFVLAVQMVLRQYFTSAGLPPHHPWELVSFSAAEEILKFLAVYFFISKKRDFNEPLDAMIYMVTVALGFAAVENIASLGQQNGNSTSLLGIPGIASVEVLALRFFGATFLHSLTSAVVGFHWAHALAKGKSVVVSVSIGLGLAILLHAVFNYLILETGPLTWVISFVTFIGFFVLSDFEELKAEDHD